MLILFLDLSVEPAGSSPTTVSVYIIEPGFSVGAPWDRVRIGINVTDAEYPIETPRIFYTFSHIDKDFSLWEANFSVATMQLEEGNEFWGCWSYELPQQENGTVIWYYVSLKDSSGSQLSPISSREEANQFRILIPASTFRIQYLAIDVVDEKNLTADITCSIMMRDGSSDRSFLTVYLSDQVSRERTLRVARAGERFFYSSQFAIQGLRLIGDPTSFPFDNYELRLSFYSPLTCDPTFEPGDVRIVDYNDRSIWTIESDQPIEERQVGSRVTATMSLGRKIENTYYFVVPTIICFILLGGSHTLPSNEDTGLRNRLTIYLTVFVFVMGSFSANQVIQNMIPAMAQRITIAELTLTWLAAYLGVYAFFSLLGYFSRDWAESWLLDLLDMFALAVSLCFFFFFPVVNIALPYDDRVLIHSLAEHIPCSAAFFEGMILLGLSYGWILSVTRKHLRQTADLSKAIHAVTSRVARACQVRQPNEIVRSNRSSSETGPEVLSSGESEASSGSKESPSTHEAIDHLFEIALVLVTVLSASQMQFVSVKTPDQLDIVFKELTLPIIIVILSWLIKELIPSRLPLKRFLKEFCWAFLAFSLTLEIGAFIESGFATTAFQIDLSIKIMVFAGAFLTFPVTWTYADVGDWKTEKWALAKVIIEHYLIYCLSYFALIGVIFASFLPPP